MLQFFLNLSLLIYGPKILQEPFSYESKATEGKYTPYNNLSKYWNIASVEYIPNGHSNQKKYPRKK